MRRRRISYSPQEIREKLPVELGHVDRLADLQPSAATFVSDWRAFIIELQSLAATDTANPAKVQGFIHRIREVQSPKEREGD